MISTLDRNIKSYENLKDTTAEIITLRESLSLTNEIFIRNIKLLPLLLWLKLRNEYYYRKYGEKEDFRTFIEDFIADIYRKTEEKAKELSLDKQKREELFIKVVSDLAFSKKVKNMLKEDAEEAIQSVKMQKELSKHKEQLKEIFQKLNTR